MDKKQNAQPGKGDSSMDSSVNRSPDPSYQPSKSSHADSVNQRDPNREARTLGKPAARESSKHERKRNGDEAIDPIQSTSTGSRAGQINSQGGHQRGDLETGD